MPLLLINDVVVNIDKTQLLIDALRIRFYT